MADIDVHEKTSEAELSVFVVAVTGAGATSLHDVTVARPDFDRLRRPAEAPEEFVRRCFEFLLEREPKESILSRFAIHEIGHYFPEFEEQISAGRSDDPPADA